MLNAVVAELSIHKLKKRTHRFSITLSVAPKHVFRVLRNKKRLLQRVLRAFFFYCYSTQSASFVLDCFGNKGFMSQNAAADASNQHLIILTSKGRNGYCFKETFK